MTNAWWHCLYKYIDTAGTPLYSEKRWFLSTMKLCVALCDNCVYRNIGHNVFSHPVWIPSDIFARKSFKLFLFSLLLSLSIICSHLYSLLNWQTFHIQCIAMVPIRFSFSLSWSLEIALASTNSFIINGIFRYFGQSVFGETNCVTFLSLSLCRYA